MADRRGARLVTQRKLEAEPTTEPSAGPPPAPPGPPEASHPPARPANEPVPPSNRGLLDRQLRWHRERARFESGRGSNDRSQ